MSIILAIAILLAAGTIVARALIPTGCPRVLGYLIAGVLLGATVLRFLPAGFIKAGDTVGTIALGFIAFEIGDTFRIKNLKQLGNKGVTLSVVQAVFTFGLVFVGFLLLEQFHITNLPHALPAALLFASTAASTAPAPTFMVVQEYKAKGPLTNYLLMAVTLDDAVGIVLFDISMVIMRMSLRGGPLHVSQMILVPLQEIGLATLIGAVAGLLMVFLSRWFRSKMDQLLLALTIVVATVGVCDLVNVEGLLACMIVGALFANMAPKATDTLSHVDDWTAPLLLMFFVFSGADINLALLPKYALIAVAYFLLRGIGKVYGCGAAARIVKAPGKVQKYLGWAMLPQAGVNIGFAVMARAAFPELSSLTSIVLSIVIVFTMIGALGAKYALFGAREVDPSFLKQPPKTATPT